MAHTPDILQTRLGRRRILQLAAASATAFSTAAFAEATLPPVKAIGFDGFVIFDPAPISAVAEELFPGTGNQLNILWRIRQFEYCWLRTLNGRYADFWTVTQDALLYAAAATGVELTPDRRDRLMQAWLTLKIYPDVLPGLHALRNAGIRLTFVSNLTERMLQALIAANGLGDLFEQPLSTDRVHAFKPDPRAYRMAIDAFSLRRDEIVFAAFGGWDAAGAKSFGYRTYWANRLKLPTEELDTKPDAVGDGLPGLVRFAAKV